jgi:hypothetical protein
MVQEVSLRLAEETYKRWGISYSNKETGRDQSKGYSSEKETQKIISIPLLIHQGSIVTLAKIDSQTVFLWKIYKLA